MESSLSAKNMAGQEASSKIKAIMTKLKINIEKNEKTVIFTNFLGMLNLMEN